MKTNSPLSTTELQAEDQLLVQQAVTGNRAALTQLIQTHHQYIYNIALKFLGNLEDAQDATQEILIKLITNLGTYDAEKAKFRTWLYRVAVNFLLNYKKSATEQKIVGFEQFFGFIGDLEDSVLPAALQEEEAALTKEVKLKCMNGMLMCVPREDRLLYILGDLFGVDHKTGAALFEISPASYRKKLSRTRQQLRQWMNNKCGLINKENPCRCARKTKGFIEKGIVDPDNLLWNETFQYKIKDYTSQNMDEILKSSDYLYTRLYQEQPFREGQQTETFVADLLADETLSDIFRF